MPALTGLTGGQMSEDPKLLVTTELATPECLNDDLLTQVVDHYSGKIEMSETKMITMMNHVIMCKFCRDRLNQYEQICARHNQLQCDECDPDFLTPDDIADQHFREEIESLHISVPPERVNDGFQVMTVDEFCAGERWARSLEA